MDEKQRDALADFLNVVKKTMTNKEYEDFLLRLAKDANVFPKEEA